MPNVLRNLTIREVSSVDRGAGKGVKIKLMKRKLADDLTDQRRGRGRAVNLFQHQAAARAAFAPAASDKKPKKKEKSMRSTPEIETYLKRNAVADAEVVAKRTFSNKERRTAAAAGHAMPGGGYPINDATDLHNAVQAFGRAKNPKAAKAHIRRQAARLDLAGSLPAKWSKTGKRFLVETAGDLGTIATLMKNAVSFDELLAEMSSTDYAEGVIEAVRDACHALKESIESIAECDDLDPSERSDAIKESFEQFLEHLSGIDPTVTKAMKRGVGPMSKLTKKLKKAYTSVPAHDATPPAKDKDVKIENDADKNVTAGTGVDSPHTASSAKKLRKEVARLEERAKLWKSRTTAALTLEKAEKDYMDDPDSDMDEDKKTKFLDMTSKERSKHMKDNPLATLAQKRLATLPEPVRKQFEQGQRDSVELAKQLETSELIEFGKRATEVGQPVEFGKSLRLLAKGAGTVEDRTKAFDEVMKALQGYAEQAKTAGLFKEFGNGSTATGSAYDQLVGKADAMMGEINKSLKVGERPLTKEMAFDRVYSDPANADLVRQYKTDTRRAA